MPLLWWFSQKKSLTHSVCQAFILELMTVGHERFIRTSCRGKQSKYSKQQMKYTSNVQTYLWWSEVHVTPDNNACCSQSSTFSYGTDQVLLDWREQSSLLIRLDNNPPGIGTRDGDVLWSGSKLLYSTDYLHSYNNTSAQWINLTKSPSLITCQCI